MEVPKACRHTVYTPEAFEAVHNQVQTWAERYSTVATLHSYSVGVADGLCSLPEEENLGMEGIAMETEQKALAARIRVEYVQVMAELDSLRKPASSPTPEPGFD